MRIPSLKIGGLLIEPGLVLAPMAGITSWPHRLLCRRFGAQLAYTEMIPAAAIVRGRLQADVITALKTHPLDRPLGFQLFGADPEEVAAAGRSLAALEADLIDINMGCPVRKVVHSRAGCALMQDLPRAATMVRAARAAVQVPLTVKMRLGWDRDSRNAAELARVCAAEGADAVIVHGRTRSQGFAGPVDLEGIREVVQAVRIPVIGNGGINSRADALAMLERTGCAGVMVARGARGNPWLFAAIAEGEDSPRAHPTPADKAAVILEHLQGMIELGPERKAVLEMRKHLAWYSRGLARAGELRRELGTLTTPEQARNLVARYFQEDAV